jgi:hypothetical protein
VTDTAPALEQRYAAMLMARPGAERLKMACAAFDTARKLARASIVAAGPHASPAEIRRALFTRVYGDDFDPVAMARILAVIERFRSSTTPEASPSGASATPSSPQEE